MPVARIISSSFEDALRFADYLRPLYDTVEIAQPGRAYDTAVDLEVNLELCSPEQAWEQIAQLSQRPDSEIFVAPGALFPETQAKDQANSETAVAPEAEPAIGISSGGTPEEFDSAGLEVDAAIAQASAMAVTAAGSNGSGTHKPHSTGAVPEEELNWLGRARESLRQWRAVRALLREIREVQQEELAREQQRHRQMALQFERDRRERDARELAAARAALQPPSVPKQEQLEQASLAEQDALQRQADDAELQRQVDDAELQSQAEQEEAVRRGFFVEQILRRRAAEETSQAAPLAASPDGEAVPVEFQAVPEESFAPEAQITPVVRFVSGPRNDRLRPAMALAGITSVLLMAVLVGYAHRRPASPVPLSVLQRSSTVEQKVPFGPAVIPTTPVPMPVMQIAAEELPEAAPLPERHSFRSDFHRVRVDGHEVDYVATDVTVRHFSGETRGNIARHPASAVPVSANTRGIKQISDME